MCLNKREPASKLLPSGETLLTASVEEGLVDVLGVLLKKGVDVNETNINGHSALHRAAIKGDAEMTKMLAEHGIELELGNRQGMTALHLACFHGNFEVVQMLLDMGCCPRGSKFPAAASPMMLSMANNEVALLLMKHGADINAKEFVGKSAFSEAVSGGNVPLVNAMLSLATPNLAHTSHAGFNIFHGLFGLDHSSPVRQEYCEVFIMIIEYAHQNERHLNDFKQALTEAMPFCVRCRCVPCLERALPFVNIHHVYGNSGDLLLLAMSSEKWWSFEGSRWNFRKDRLYVYGLGDAKPEIALCLLEAGASLTTTKELVIEPSFSKKRSTRLSKDEYQMYMLYIRAWGIWSADYPESSYMFQSFVFSQGFARAAALICWAGYHPNEEDFNLIALREMDNGASPLGIVFALTETFVSNPRPLANIAAVCIRNCFKDNVFHKMKTINLPKCIEGYITLKYYIDVICFDSEADQDTVLGQTDSQTYNFI